MKYAVAPGESMEIQVTAKKWLWQFEYPDGSRTVNEMHVPVNKPVRFVMTSEDVLHDFFVPDMRVKHDIVPGRYTEVWFTPTVLGEHHVTCAEYCGKGHSDMHAKLMVDKRGGFREMDGDRRHRVGRLQRQAGRVGQDAVGAQGLLDVPLDRRHAQARGGPSWKGIWGKMVKMNDGKLVLVDDAYVRESMMQPQAKIVAGFDPIMPTFQGLLREQEIQGLMAFIKSLERSERRACRPTMLCSAQAGARSERGDGAQDRKQDQETWQTLTSRRASRTGRGPRRIISTRPRASGAGCRRWITSASA